MKLFAFTVLSFSAFCTAGVLGIISGKDTNIGNFPYQISLQQKGNSFHFCGGLVLSENYVITAAHCVEELEPKNIKVSAGSNNLEDPNVVRNVEKYTIHEGYNPDTRKNDIALLKVDEPFPTTPEIGTAVLPEPSDNVYPLQPAAVIGWGSLQEGGPPSPILQEANISIADQSICRTLYKLKGYDIYDSQVCAIHPVIPKGVSKGDEGGPLIVNGKVVGITSYGYADGVFPSVFTRVTSYLDWIANNTNS